MFILDLKCLQIYEQKQFICSCYTLLYWNGTIILSPRSYTSHIVYITLYYVFAHRPMGLCWDEINHQSIYLFDREVACWASDCQVSNFELCVRKVSSHSIKMLFLIYIFFSAGGLFDIQLVICYYKWDSYIRKITIFMLTCRKQRGVNWHTLTHSAFTNFYKQSSTFSNTHSETSSYCPHFQNNITLMTDQLSSTIIANVQQLGPTYFSHDKILHLAWECLLLLK